jgi:CelD/BcsL family acetyltransferase involved in cellulose biosynthesis
MSDAVEWVVEPSRLAELAAEWDDLASGPLRPFLASSWFRCWWDAFGEDQRLRTCVLRRDGRVAGVFPLHGRDGGGLLAMANDHSPVFRPLAADQRALDALVSAVLDSCAQLEVDGIPSGDAALEGLDRAARRHRWLRRIQSSHVSPIVATRGDFGQYREPRKRRWREIERRRRKLSREHATEFHLVTEPGELERELEEGLRLEASGWKGEAGTAILAAPSTAAFYRSLARSLHESGELRLSSVRSDGDVIAFDLALVHGSRYFLIKTAYDERWRSFAPGLMLRLATIERCFELGLEAHEFLGADADWKELFATGVREHSAFRAYSARPLPIARFAWRHGARPVLRRGYRVLRPAR